MVEQVTKQEQIAFRRFQARRTRRAGGSSSKFPFVAKTASQKREFEAFVAEGRLSSRPSVVNPIGRAGGRVSGTRVTIQFIPGVGSKPGIFIESAPVVVGGSRSGQVINEGSRVFAGEKIRAGIIVTQGRTIRILTGSEAETFKASGRLPSAFSVRAVKQQAAAPSVQKPLGELSAKQIFEITRELEGRIKAERDPVARRALQSELRVQRREVALRSVAARRIEKATQSVVPPSRKVQVFSAAGEKLLEGSAFGVVPKGSSLGLGPFAKQSIISDIKMTGRDISASRLLGLTGDLGLQREIGLAVPGAGVFEESLVVPSRRLQVFGPSGERVFDTQVSQPLPGLDVTSLNPFEVDRRRLEGKARGRAKFLGLESPTSVAGGFGRELLIDIPRKIGGGAIGAEQFLTEFVSAKRPVSIGPVTLPRAEPGGDFFQRGGSQILRVGVLSAAATGVGFALPVAQKVLGSRVGVGKIQPTLGELGFVGLETASQVSRGVPKSKVEVGGRLAELSLAGGLIFGPRAVQAVRRVRAGRVAAAQVAGFEIGTGRVGLGATPVSRLKAGDVAQIRGTFQVGGKTFRLGGRAEQFGQQIEPLSRGGRVSTVIPSGGAVVREITPGGREIVRGLGQFSVQQGLTTRIVPGRFVGVSVGTESQRVGQQAFRLFEPGARTLGFRFGVVPVIRTGPARVFTTGPQRFVEVERVARLPSGGEFVTGFRQPVVSGPLVSKPVTQRFSVQILGRGREFVTVRPTFSFRGTERFGPVVAKGRGQFEVGTRLFREPVPSGKAVSFDIFREAPVPRAGVDIVSRRFLKSSGRFELFKTPFSVETTRGVGVVGRDVGTRGLIRELRGGTSFDPAQLQRGLGFARAPRVGAVARRVVVAGVRLPVAPFLGLQSGRAGQVAVLSRAPPLTVTGPQRVVSAVGVGTIPRPGAGLSALSQELGGLIGRSTVGPGVAFAGPSFLFGREARVRVVPSVLSRQRVGGVQRLDLFTRAALSPRVSTDVVPRLDTVVQSRVGVVSRLGTGQVARQDVGVVPQLDLVTVPRSSVIPRGGTSLVPDVGVPGRPPPPPGPVLFPLFGGRESVRSRRGFDTFVKSKGSKKFFKANKRPLPRNRAFNLGSEVVDGSVSATFRVKKTPGKVSTLLPEDKVLRNRRKFRKPKGSSKLRGAGTFIEKNAFRIDSPGELRGITAKGLLALKRRRQSVF